MSNLSSEIPPAEEAAETSEKTSSPSVMLITMVLLIAALSLTGIMMIHYANARKASSDETAGTEPPADSSLSEKASEFFKSLQQPKAEAPDAAAEEESSGGFSGLFSSRDGSVRWPKLELTGLGTSADGKESFAIINDQQYHTGQLINGKIKVVEVRSHEVIVEYKGETQSLRVNTRN